MDVTACTLRLAFLKALFLTALASGNRCAELAHFSRRALVDSGSHFTLGVMPRFLYKNQASGRSPPPVSIPLFRANPALCPVVTLRGYLARTALVAHKDFLFVHPTSSASLVAGRMNYWVVQAISNLNLTYFNLNLTYFNLNLTYFKLNLTYFNLNKTYFNLNKTYFNLNKTYFNLNLTYFNLNLTYFNLNLTYFKLNLTYFK